MIPRVGDIATSGGSSVYLVASLSRMKTWTTALGFLPCDIVVSYEALVNSATILPCLTRLPYLNSLVLEDLLVKSTGFLSHGNLGLFELGLVLVQVQLEVGSSLGTLNRLALVQLQGLLGQAAHRVCRRSNLTQHRECSTHFHLLTSFNPTGSRLSTRFEQHSGASF